MGAYDDSIAKELHLRFMQQNGTDEHGIPTYELYELVENDRIIAESMTLTMGVLEGTHFELGSYVVPEMTITFSYNGNRYKNKCVRVWINDTPTDVIPDPPIYGLIFGRVYQETLSENRDKITITIRNIFYEIFNTYINWNSTFFAGVPKNTEGQVGLKIYMRTIEDFYKMLFERTICYGCGVYDKTKFSNIISSQEINDELAKLELYYANYSENNNNNIIKYISQLNDENTTYSGEFPFDKNTTFNLGQLWKWFGELSGVHWVIPMPKYSDISDIEAETIQYGKDVFISPIRILCAEFLQPSTTLFYPDIKLYPLVGGEVPLPNIDNPVSLIPFYMSCQYDETVKTKYSAAIYDNSEIFIIIDNIPFEEARPFIIDGGNIFFDKGSRDYGVTQESGQPGGYNYYSFITSVPEFPNSFFGDHIKQLKGADADYNATPYSGGYARYYNQYLYNLDKITYAILDCVFDPELSIGQCVSITTQDDIDVVIPLISCQINGINSLKATYKTTAVVER